MLHQTSLISTIVAALVLAFVFAALANRFRQPPLVGYLLAGVLVGPYTPGFVADQELAPQLAEIGVVLLMFGVGLQFSPRDLMSVRSIAVSGALVQMAVATLLGLALGTFLGWPMGGSLLFGLALSVASTMVLLKWLQDRHLLETERGRIAVGWLVVEDLAMVLALVLIPTAARMSDDGALSMPEPLAAQLAAVIGFPPGIGLVIAAALLKVAFFILLMMLVGRRLVPLLLHWVAHTGSRELFRLAVLATALGIAFGAAEIFGASLALGAFFAGMVLSESRLSSRAAQESLPLRDAFAVLFFVSVGMLFDPASILADPVPVLMVVLIIVVGRSVAAFLVVLAFRHTVATALVIASSRAQIGEFSFILAELGVALGLLPPEGRSLILAGAMITILINPLVVFGAERLRPALEAWLRTAPGSVEPAGGEPADQEVSADRHGPSEAQEAAAAAEGTSEPQGIVPEQVPSTQAGHTVLIGFGNVGRFIGAVLDHEAAEYLVVEASDGRVAALRERGVEAFAGNAARPGVLALTNLEQARALVVAIPEVFEAGQIIAQAREMRPDIPIVARAHSVDEVEHLKGLGADIVVSAERELGRGMLKRLGEIAPDTLDLANRADLPAIETPPAK
jgi:CPA2 family monovalent cation:H+ antiporter-2